mgnify:CR=1 FL=1
MTHTNISQAEKQQPRRILMVAGLASSLQNFRGPLIKAMIARGHDVHVAAPDLIHEKTRRVFEANRLSGHPGTQNHQLIAYFR